jgi:hypothetical protein
LFAAALEVVEVLEAPAERADEMGLVALEAEHGFGGRDGGDQEARAEVGRELFGGVGAARSSGPGGIGFLELLVDELRFVAADAALAPLEESDLLHHELLLRTDGLEALLPGAVEVEPLQLGLVGGDYGEAGAEAVGDLFAGGGEGREVRGGLGGAAGRDGAEGFHLEVLRVIWVSEI